MNWLNLKVCTLRHPFYIGCDPAQRGTWLNVLGYCVEQENSGRIENSKAWKDRQWQQTCGVMLSEVNECAPLLTWEEHDLIVWGYPLDKQREVSEKREVAKHNGTKGGRPKKPTKETNEEPTSVLPSKPTNNQHPKAEGKGKENGMEGEMEENEGTHKPSKARGSVVQLSEYAQEIGLPATDGEWAFDKWEGTGWTNGGSTIKDWKATMRAWKKAGYMASQKNGTPQLAPVAYWTPDGPDAHKTQADDLRDCILQNWPDGPAKDRVSALIADSPKP